MSKYCEIVQDSKIWKCSKCGKTWNKKPRSAGYCPAEGYYSRWSDVPKTLKTVGQWAKLGKRPAKDASSKAAILMYMYGSGHFWANLWSEDQVVAIKSKTPEEKAIAKEKARLNRICYHCKREQSRKIYRKDGLCDRCVEKRACILDCRDWLNSDLIIIDTETTGLSAGDDEVLQIGIVAKDGTVLLDTLIKPSEPIDESPGEEYETDWGDIRYLRSAFEVHGISNEKVKDAPTFNVVWPQLLEIVHGKNIVAYNASFDGSMLVGNAKQLGLNADDFPQIDCAMDMYAQWWGELHRKGGYRWVSLSKACEYEKISIHVPSHTVVGDCLRTLELIKIVAAKDLPEGRQP